MKGLIIIGFSLITTACATPQYNYRPETKNISEPAIGSIQTVQVGEELLKQGSYAENEAIKISSNIDIGFAYTLMPGYYMKHGEDGKSGFYVPTGDAESGRIDKAVLADPWVSIQAYNDKSQLCVITAFHAASCEKNALFEVVKKPTLSMNSFQQTLIYSGKIGDKINVGYREFSGNVARPAFNNDVEYDLKESPVIGYKGARIEIIEATNQYLKYKVIANFNKAAM